VKRPVIGAKSAFI